MQINKLHPKEVRLLLNSQKATIEHVSPSLGPHGPVKLADSIKKLIETLEKLLEDYLQTVKSSPDQESETDIGMRIFARYLTIIHNDYFPYLLAAEPYSFPVELLHPFKYLLNRFAGYDEKTISFGLLQWDEYNFRIARFLNPLKSITREIQQYLQLGREDEINEAMKNLPEIFIFFNYPHAEGRNILLQGVLFHELGHAIDSSKSMSSSIFNVIKWSAEEEKIPTIFENWVREIIADLVAIRTVGPSVLFSLRTAALTAGRLHTDSISHPSSQFRFLWMLEHLERMGYLKKNSKWKTFTVISQMYKQLKEPEILTGSPPEFAQVRAVLNDSALRESLHANVEKAIDSLAFDAPEFISNVPQIVQDFADQLPNCGEGIEPATHIAAVFNAVWEKYFRDSEDETLEANISAETDILCGLALKSVESNFIQHLWNAK